LPQALPGVPPTLAKSGGDVTLQWGASCMATDTDYEVYEGTIGSFYSHTERLCSTGGALSATLTPSPGTSYYLVVPRSASSEGSYGRDRSGNERPSGSSTCVARALGSCP